MVFSLLPEFEERGVAHMSVKEIVKDEGRYSPIWKDMKKDRRRTADILAVWKSRDVR